MKELLCNQLSDSAWDKFVEVNKSSTMEHLSGWKDVIERSYKLKTYYLHVVESGELSGILPLVFMKSSVFGRQLVSMPFLDCGGICVKDGEDTNDIVKGFVNGVLNLSKELKTDLVDLRHLYDLNLGWKTNLLKVNMVMELKPDEDSMWKALSSERRNRIRKSKKNELGASFYGLDAIDEFYNIIAVNMRDLGSPVHSKNFFINIMRVFENRTKIIVVKQGSKPVGAALCFFFKDTISVPWVSSLRDSFRLYPNNILYWEVIRYGCNHGYKRFDFGRSSIGSGTFEFKKQWGAKPVQLYWDYYNTGKNTENLNQDISSSLKYQLALKIWKKIPVSLSKIIGPGIRKFISN